MTTEIEKTDVNQFIALIFQGTQVFIEAGELAAAAIARNPRFVDEVCDKCTDITPEFVRRMEAVGLKRLRPAWVINQSPGARRIARLAYELQAKHEKEPIELVIEGGETLLVDVRNLTPDQAAQVFAEDRIRTNAEQRTYMEDRKSKRQPAPARPIEGYEIKRGKLRIFGDQEFTLKELRAILTQMENR